jgi:uncharacterized membrane protein YoaK (UPF0700 family)
MTTAIILLASTLATAIVAWLLRRHLAASILARLPRKETVTTVCLFAPIALLLILALLPDILLLVSTMNLLPHTFRIILGIAAATVVCIGCSKQNAEPVKPAVIHWKAQDSDYEDTTTVRSDKAITQ